ncbi:MAG: hypothetical protein RR550_02815 [Rikenellaceae bacterium]
MKLLGNLKFVTRRSIEAIIFLIFFFGIFGYIGGIMGVSNMLNTIMKTAWDLLMNTVFYLMGITVLSGALGKLLIEFGVIRLLEKILSPLMKPLYNLPGVSALAGVLTFLSDNPAIIALANDKNFSAYYRKYQLVSLTNFGTAFGMGLIVITFMGTMSIPGSTDSVFLPALIGLAGAIVGSIVSTRLMQRSSRKIVGDDWVVESAAGDEDQVSFKSEGGIFLRFLNAILDGGKSGVDLGLAIIPGVLVISTAVMMMTFGPGENGIYEGLAYEGVPVLPNLFSHVWFIFEWLFGLEDPTLIAFPVTSLGAVGAALSLMKQFTVEGLVNGNTIAVFTAMGMCWSGFLSTHTAMLDTLGYRQLTSSAIISHTIGGICGGVFAHFAYMLYSSLTA